jgi:hypothetical protein
MFNHFRFEHSFYSDTALYVIGQHTIFYIFKAGWFIFTNVFGGGLDTQQPPPPPK